MSALATASDLIARLGRDLSEVEAARAAALLTDASAIVRSYTNQDFLRVTGDVVVVRAVGGTVKLPQRPVVSVDAVVAVGGSDLLPDVPLTDWVFDEVDTVRIGVGNYVINLPEVWWDDEGYPGTYRITYTHGYTVIPADVVAVVCGMTARALTTPTLQGGVVSETIGSYSYRLDAAGSGLTPALTPADKDVLKAYRRAAATLKIGR